MRRWFLILTLTISLALASVGCYKNDIMHTYHPETGLVVLMVEPPVLEEGEEMPSSYFIEVNGVIGEVVNGRVTFASLVDPGTYDIRIYNQSDAVSIDSDGIANSQGVDDIVTLRGGDVVALSDSHIYFGAGTMTISADYNDVIEIDVAPMTRKLTFEIAVSEGEVEKVESIDMSFTGVAGSWHCINGEAVGDAKSVKSTFEIVATRTRADGDTGYSLNSSLYLLGLIGDEHNLEVTIHYQTGVKQVISSSITSELKGFNDDKSKSLVLSSQTALMTETYYNATITDWEVAEDNFDFEVGPEESLRLESDE